MIQLERLAAAGISLVPAFEITTHFVLERHGFAALVERRDEGFGSIGSAGLLTEDGFAALVWRGADPWFVRKGWERPATAAEVADLRSFSEDLKKVLA